MSVTEIPTKESLRQTKVYWSVGFGGWVVELYEDRYFLGHLTTVGRVRVYTGDNGSGSARKAASRWRRRVTT